MDILENTPLFEIAPLTPRTPATSSGVAARDDRARARDRETELNTNFENMLVERQERPDEKKVSADASRPEATPETTTAGTAGSAGTAGAAGTDGVPDTSDKATVVGDSGKHPTAAIEAATSAGGPGPSTAMPSILAQGLTVQEQQPAPQATTKLPVPALDSQLPTTTDADKQAAPKTVPLLKVAGPTVPVATGTIVGAAQNETATLASAAELEAAAKGRETYIQAPVVSESQLLTDSLKNVGKTTAPVTNDAASADGKPGLELPAAMAADTGADGQARTTDQEQGANTSAAAVAEVVVGEVALETSNDPARAEKMPVTVTPTQTPTQAAADPEKSEALPASSAAAAVGADQSPITEAEKQVVAAPSEATSAEPAPAAVDPAQVRRPQGEFQVAQTQTSANAGTARGVRHQVVQHLAGRLDSISGQQQMTIKLNPESLGQIELHFESQGDRLTVSISASTPEAETALRENLKDLTDRVVERSARFSQVDIRVEIKDTADSQKDSKQDQKQDQKQDGRQDQRREQERQGEGRQHGSHGQQAHQTRQAWENAMNWELEAEPTGKEG